MKMTSPVPTAENAEATKPAQSFYYTFGTSAQFPYQKGWVEVQAEDRHQADTFFRSRFPDVHKGVLNCSFVYTQEQFTRILENDYARLPDWKICHELISKDPHAKPGIEVQAPEKASLSEQIKAAESRRSSLSAGTEHEKDPIR